MRCHLPWLAALALSALSPAPALAKCRTPPLEFLWSYPADGAVDVPTNAQFWALTPYPWTPPVASLNGVPLTVVVEEGARGTAHGSLGALEPLHDYVLRLDYGGVRPQEDAGAPRVVEITFRTGAGPAERLVAPPMRGHPERNELAGAQCPEVVRAQDCYDTGPNVLLTFDVSAPRAVGWLVDGRVLPARCGRPVAFVGRYGRDLCFQIQALGPGGFESAATEYCAGDLTDGTPEGMRMDEVPIMVDEAPASAEASGGEGCSIAEHPTGPACASYLVAIVLLLRRRASRSGEQRTHRK
jgi:hypothetical protein